MDEREPAVDTAAEATGDTAAPRCEALEGGGLGCSGEGRPCQRIEIRGEGEGTTTEEPTGPERLEGGSCGCQTGWGGSALWLSVLVCAWFRRAAWVAALFLATAAHAVDIEHLEYGAGGSWAAVREGDVGAPWSVRLALAASVVRAPAVLRYDGGERIVVPWSSSSELAAAIGLHRIQLAATLPIHPVTVQEGEVYAMVPGDLGVRLTIPLVEPNDRAQVSWTVGVDAASGNSELLLGERGAVLGSLAGDVRVAERWRIGTHLGGRLRAADDIPGATWGSAVEYGLAGAYERHRWQYATELFGSVGVASSAPSTLPLEVLGSARYRATDAVALRMGGGTGLGHGLGNPRYRALVAVEVAASLDHDADHDRFPDLRDRCPTRPEDRDGFRDRDGCPEPDNDKDTLLDEVDGCPLEAEVWNGWRDDDGCPDERARITFSVAPGPPRDTVVTVAVDGARVARLFPDEDVVLELDPAAYAVEATADGFLAMETVHVAPEGPSTVVLALAPVPSGAVVVHVVDPEHQPILAAEVDVGELPTAAAPYGAARIPLPPGPVAVSAVARGFHRREIEVVVPEEGEVEVELCLNPLEVAIVGRQLVLGENVRFALDSDATRGSEGGLDALAAWLLAHPEIELLRIEGHADDDGRPWYNLDLSRRRADAVRDELVARGVAAGRLDPIGSGEAYRSAEAPSERLVEFLVLVWDESASPEVLDVPE